MSNKLFLLLRDYNADYYYYSQIMSDSELGLRTGRSYEEVLEQRQDDEGYKTATTNEQVCRSLHKIIQNIHIYFI